MMVICQSSTDYRYRSNRWNLPNTEEVNSRMAPQKCGAIVIWVEKVILLCYNGLNQDDATGSLHLEPPNWWYVFAACFTIMATQR